MAWVTLALRKQTLQSEVNELTYQDLELSRKLRQVHRHLSYETSIFNGYKRMEINSHKEAYDAYRNSKESKDSYNPDDHEGMTYQEYLRDVEWMMAERGDITKMINNEKKKKTL